MLAGRSLARDQPPRTPTGEKAYAHRGGELVSVVATVKVYDGIVLGAESMTQLTMNIPGQPRPQVIKSYENAQKLFQVAEKPIGILTYGIGNIGRRSVESFVHQFSRSERARPPEAVNVAETAERFFQFINGHHGQAFGAMPEKPAMGFVIAGYTDNEHLASEFEFILPQHMAPVPVGDQNSVGAIWRGVQQPFSRIMFGIDPTVEGQLRSQGATDAEIQRLATVMQKVATTVAFDGMPLADAIGYCKFIIQATIGWCKYALGSPACGGPIKLATITPGGFEWITAPKPYIEGEPHAAAPHHH
jgi:hypothetical protein